MPRRHKRKPKEVEPFEPDLYPSGSKIFKARFDYGYDIAIPGTRPIHVRLPKENELETGTVQVERINGSITIDEARISTRSKNLTRSNRRISKNTPTITAELNVTQPLHYRVHKYGKLVAPVYRTKITVKFFGAEKSMGAATKRAVKFFNQYLKAYRVASGDPVPYVHENKQELRMTLLHYDLLDQITLSKINDTSFALRYLEKADPKLDGGMSVGFNSSDFDMAPKPYYKHVALKTVEYSLLPEHIPLYNEPIIEAIELAHRKNEYGLGIVLLNLALEGALTYFLIACLALLGYDEKASEKFITVDHKDLEDKRKVFDDTREQVLTKFGMSKMKRFRGSAEERNWDATTYKKRHIVVHVTNANSDEITKSDFKKALEATQKAIALLDFPIDEISKLRKQAQAAKP